MEAVRPKPILGKGEWSINIFNHFNSLTPFYSIVALLDLADEQLECSSVIIALRRNSPELDGLIHGLMYVGGQVVTRPPFKASQDYILIGLEI
jgi:hypothetical protein